MAFTKIVSPGIDTTGSYTVQELNTVGVMTAGTVQVGSATTVHTTGIDLGSGNITSHNINSTGIITAASFVGPVTGAITGTATTATNAEGLTGSPSITVTNITAAGNVSIAGTLTYEDVTNVDSIGIVTAQSGVHIDDSIVHIGDTDTKIRFPANNTITAETGGTERFRITGAGSVGIGITDPDRPLHVKQNNAAAAKFGGEAGGDFAIEIGQLSSSSSPGFNATGPTASMLFKIGGTEKLRIDSSGRLLKSGQAALTSTSLSHPIQVASASDANAIAIFGRAADDIGELSFYEADKSTKLGELQYRQDHLNFRHRVGYISFATGGTTERLRIASNGTTTVGPQYDQVKIEPGNGIYDGEAATLSVDGRTNDGNRVAFKVDRYLSGTSADTKFSINYAGLVNIGGAQFTTNTTPSSGRGVEIFEAGTGVGQIASFNRDGNGWDELRIKGSELKLYAGTTNTLTLNLQSTQSTLYGTSDGILNLDTTDGRGAFIRFKENGTTKGWAGCSEGIGTGGDQDDFGIRAVGGFRLRTGANNSIEVNDEGQIKLRPLTSGFTTLGATNTYPGAAVSIQCAGIGAGTGTNIPQYGLYVDGAHSSNDATLMTGVFATAKQNTQGNAIGIHGLYYQDWNSYSKKIGGLFQAPCRSSRNATRSFNPGGGMFANTTSTGFANRLASGAAQPNGTTPSNSTYGDNTALWGDCFRSDTDTSSEFSQNIAIKATNRVNHGHSRVGLMVGTVDGNDTSHNRRRVQSVEYYTEDSYQRFYNRNHKKEMNHHEPLFMSTTDGSRNTMNNVWTANYYVQKYQGNNQYSWYFYNTHSSSYARCGRLKFNITWTTGHASGVGEAEYSVVYTVPHSGGTILMRRCTRFHQWSVGGSYYGWNWNPDVSFFHSTSTGNDAGIYLRLAGAQSPFDGYVVQSIKLEALESNYGFSTEASFRWVSHSTPSDAAANPESINPPYTS